MTVKFYDQKNGLLECTCGYIWKPLMFDEKEEIDPSKYECPNCEGVKQ